MKRSVTVLLLITALALLSACTTSTTPQASPSPSMAPTTMMTPTVEPAPSIAATIAPNTSPDMVSGASPQPVGTNVTIMYNGAQVQGTPYYDAQKMLIFPLKPLAEAMAWTVEEANNGTQQTMTLTHAGEDDVIVAFTKPTLGKDMATQVTAKKGTTSLTLPDSLSFIDNNLYVPESFVKEALGNVTVKQEGNQIVITPAS